MTSSGERAGNARVPAPGPSGGDMLRAMTRIRRDPLGFLRDMADTHGDVVEFPMPRRPALLLNHPDAVRHVLQTNHKGYDRETVQYRTLSLVTGGGLLTSSGDRWLRHRRLMAPAFHREAVATLVGHVGAAADRTADDWRAAVLAAGGTRATVDVDQAMMRATLEVVGGALFSTDLTGDADELVHAVVTALDGVIARARNPLLPPPLVPTVGNVRLRGALRTLDRAVDRMVDARLDAERAGATAAPTADLLGMLVAGHDPDAGPDDVALSRQELRDEVVTLVVAGHETVASALTWTWWLLSGHPEHQARLHAEVDTVLGGRRPTVADAADLPWTRAVVDEALRLYPPAWLISRRAAVDDVVLGQAVPAGSLVFLSPWVLHRHPEVWDDPDAFEPERFLVDRTGQVPTAPARGAYVPFGTGPNLCIGRDFALLESVLLVASLASRFRFVRAPGRTVRVDPLVTLRPRGGLPLDVVLR